MTSYERFLNICNEKSIAPTTAMVQAGLSKALANKWKTTPDFVPNGMTLMKLSKFFNVSADYFLVDGQNPVHGEPADIALLSRAMRNMTEQQRKEVVHYAEYICPHAFDTKGD